MTTPHPQRTLAPLSAPLPFLHDRRQASGSICSLCRLCARLGIAHCCITEPGPIDVVVVQAPREEWEAVLASLRSHPARPFDGAGERRGVHESWCFCQHEPAGAVVAASGEG